MPHALQHWYARLLAVRSLARLEPSRRGRIERVLFFLKLESRRLVHEQRT